MHTYTHPFIPIHTCLHKKLRQDNEYLRMSLGLCKTLRGNSPNNCSIYTIFQDPPLWSWSDHIITCVIKGMYGYERVGISMHEYLLAPSKVWTVFLTKNCKFVAPYWGVTWSVVCYYRYVWVWNVVYTYAWVFISPQKGLNRSPAPHRG